MVPVRCKTEEKINKIWTKKRGDNSIFILSSVCSTKFAEFFSGDWTVVDNHKFDL